MEQIENLKNKLVSKTAVEKTTEKLVRRLYAENARLQKQYDLDRSSSVIETSERSTSPLLDPKHSTVIISTSEWQSHRDTKIENKKLRKQINEMKRAYSALNEQLEIQSERYLRDQDLGVRLQQCEADKDELVERVMDLTQQLARRCPLSESEYATKVQVVTDAVVKALQEERSRSAEAARVQQELHSRIHALNQINDKLVHSRDDMRERPPQQYSGSL